MQSQSSLSHQSPSLSISPSLSLSFSPSLFNPLLSSSLLFPPSLSFLPPLFISLALSTSSPHNIAGSVSKHSFQHLRWKFYSNDVWFDICTLGQGINYYATRVHLQCAWSMHVLSLCHVPYTNTCPMYIYMYTCTVHVHECIYMYIVYCMLCYQYPVFVWTTNNKSSEWNDPL